MEPYQYGIDDALPDKGTRCTDVLSDTLEGYAGIQKANLDLEKGQLEVAYDPRLLSREQALTLLKKSGRQATTRVSQCPFKGPEACAACTAQMAGELTAHYQRLAEAAAPVASFSTNSITVNLNQPDVIGREVEAVNETFFSSDSNEKASTARLSRDRLEIILTILTVVFGLAAFILSRSTIEPVVVWFVYAMAFLSGGYYGLIDGIQALAEKRLDVNLLMIFAALGAAVIGQPNEGVILLFLFSLSNTLQSFAMDRSRKAIEKLLDLRPPVALVRRGSRLVTLPVEKLVINDVVLVRPGERLPIDGDIISGSSDINQANITGESMPVHKGAGDPVFAGTVNGNGTLEIKVTRLAQDTTLARIVRMVEEAQESKAQTQRMLDSFEQVYALVVLGGAVLLVLLPYFILGHPFEPTFYRAMTWLVVASPCALVISTPASILSAIANGAKNGVLFKGGVHLEKAAGLKVLAFDKTGTLTEGKPQLSYIAPLSAMPEDEVLKIVAAVESRSEHPIAAAFVEAASARGLNFPVANDFRAIPGQGVEGRVDGQVVWIGSERLFYDRGVHIPLEISSRLKAMEEAGQTAMLAYSQGQWLGIFGVADKLRDDAVETIVEIRKLGIEHIVILSGDNERVAAMIATRTGVGEYHAGLLPQDKVRMLKILQEKYGPVAMVGDGVNDAPALAIADVGIAMGGAGTDVALETADVVLMSDGLRKLPHTIGLAKRARVVVYQNLAFALAVIVFLVVTAFGANLPLPLGVVGHEGSTVLVVLNGLRLLAYR